MSTLCRIGIFIICAQTIIHFRPKPVYEKYLKLLLGTMILVQLLLPLHSVFKKMDGGDFLEQVNEFRKEVEMNFEEIAGDAFTVTAGDGWIEESGEAEEYVEESAKIELDISYINIAPIHVEVN